MEQVLCVPNGLAQMQALAPAVDKIVSDGLTTVNSFLT
jgi:hypothetical protein